MIIRKSGEAEIQHAHTGKVYFIDSDEIDFEVTASDERQMGAEIIYSATIEHPELGELTWTLAEYPLGAENFHETNVGPHKLLQDIEYSLEHEPEEEEEESTDKADRIKTLVEWFHCNYEDPVNRLPYNSREGGYLWIYGGPYDAREELEEQFPNEDEDIIEAAVEEIEADGLLEWAPVSRPEDYDDVRSFEDGHYEAAKPPTEIREAVSELENLIEQLPVSAPSFALGQDNLLHITFNHEQTAQINSELLNELRFLAAELADALQGTNAYIVLKEALVRYRDSLLIDPTSVSLIYARGVNFENAAYATYAEIKAGELPDLPLASRQKLTSVLDIHAAFIMAHEDGRSLVNGASAYRQNPKQAQKSLEAVKRIADAIEKSPGIFGNDVKVHVSVAIQDIDKGEHPERSNQVAATAIASVYSGLLNGIGFVAATLVGGAILGSIPGLSATGALTEVINLGHHFLLEHLTSFKEITAVTGGNWHLHKRILEIIGWILSRARL